MSTWGAAARLVRQGAPRAQRVVRSQAFWSFDRFDDPPHHDYHDDAEVVSSPKRKRQRGWSLLSRAKASVSSEDDASTRKSSSGPRDRFVPSLYFEEDGDYHHEFMHSGVAAKLASHGVDED